jgi:hypothetical protein
MIAKKLSLNLEEAAEQLGYGCAESVRKLVKEGKLARLPNTRRVLIPWWSLEHYTSANNVHSQDKTKGQGHEK